MNDKVLCKMKIKVVTLFSGYDSQCLALERIKQHHPDFDYELVAWSEFDPESKRPIDQQPAVVAHNALFPQWADRNLGDVSKIDWERVPDFDLLTMSSPCQDFSSAGLQRGGEEGSGTRSSLLWECSKAIEIKRPKYVLFENVKALVSKKFIDGFRKWQLRLESFGYRNFAQVLNAKDYGVPQNRERVFMVSIHDDDAQYRFRGGKPLDKHLIDVLEDDVAEEFFISDKMMKYFRRVDKDAKKSPLPQVHNQVETPRRVCHSDSERSARG